MTSKSVIDIYVTSKDAICCETPSKGNQVKYCIRSNNKTIWVKQDYLGYEGLSEVLASRIALNTNIPQFFPVVEYYPCYIVKDNDLKHKTVGCYSYDFHIKGTTEITFEKLCVSNFGRTFSELYKYGRGNITDFYFKLLSGLNIPFLYDYLALLFEFDRLICNEDRHTCNILVLQKENSFMPAPLFDNGAGMFSDTTYTYFSDLTHIQCLRKVKSEPFITSFDKQVKLVNSFSQMHLIINDNRVLISDLRDLYEPCIINRVSKFLNSRGFIVI